MYANDLQDRTSHATFPNFLLFLFSQACGKQGRVELEKGLTHLTDLAFEICNAAPSPGDSYPVGQRWDCVETDHTGGNADNLKGQKVNGLQHHLLN